MALCGSTGGIKPQLKCQNTEKKEPNLTKEMSASCLTEGLHLDYHIIRCRCFYHLRTDASFSCRQPWCVRDDRPSWSTEHMGRA